MNQDSEQTSLTTALVDTHCHLDDQAFSDDLEDVLEASRRANVTAWIMVGFAPERWGVAVDYSRRISGMSHILGVHPGHAQIWSPDVREQLANLLVGTDARAVGEIGLDFYRDNAPYETQHQALVDQLAIARELDLPAVFHMRDAEREMLDILEAERSLPKMVFHSFDGTERLTRFVLEHDAIVGVGGLATRKKSEQLRGQLRQIPLRSMILETDSPYLVPARQKVRRNSPAQVLTVATFLADLLDRPVNKIAESTTSNAESVFGKLLP